MQHLSRLRPSRLPLRIRLTLWYLLTLAIILLLFAGFLYWQLQRNLLNQMDMALQLAATQALVNIDDKDDQLVFRNTENISTLTQRISDDFAVYLTNGQGQLWDQMSNEEDVPILPARPGYSSYSDGDDTWRIYMEKINLPDQQITTGWIQVAQELEPMTETLESLRSQIMWGIPLVLLLAGVGGLFLASRALNPIDRMTRTAQSITANDLNQRIHYQGPADEIGRLARTFDHMMDRLQAAFDRERRFTGDAAHELRTPLTALKGRIGVTLGQPRNVPAYVETLQEMEQQVDRLIRLSNDLLLMARLEQSSQSGNMSLIALDDFLSATIDQVRPIAEAKSIALVEEVLPGIAVQGDFDLLIRLFLNLLDNAIKYTPADGRVTIQAQRQGQQVHVTIRDTGPGISEEFLPHLFERFFRVESDRSRRWQDNGQGGAGLGLSIAFEIARMHGGTISVDSQEGEGTSFIVWLPLHQ